MNKLKAIILLLIVFATQIVAQDTVHLCVGNDHNFGVTDNPTSRFSWDLDTDSFATFASAPDTHHILIDLNNKGVCLLVVEEEDLNGCFGYDSIWIEIHDLPIPIISALGPTSFCKGDSVLIELDSVFSAFLWNNNETSIYIYADSTNDYSVIVTDTNGCKDTSNIINVNVNPNPDADFIVDGFCVRTPIQFVNNSTISSGNITSNIWHFENGDVVNQDTLMYNYEFAGDYYAELFVTSDSACVDSIEKPYTIYNNPIASFEYNPFTVSTLQPEMNFIVQTPNYSSIIWKFDDSSYSVLANPLHEFEKAGTYDVWLTIIDTNQCVDSVMHTIIMYYDFVLYMPNTFTPNGDAMNETFGPKGIRMLEYKSYEFMVFSNWGAKVFGTDNPKDFWDGRNAIDGTYSWLIKIKDELGKIRQKTGSVLLIRK